MLVWDLFAPETNSSWIYHKNNHDELVSEANRNPPSIKFSSCVCKCSCVATSSAVVPFGLRSGMVPKFYIKTPLESSCSKQTGMNTIPFGLRSGTNSEFFIKTLLVSTALRWCFNPLFCVVVLCLHITIYTSCPIEIC